MIERVLLLLLVFPGPLLAADECTFDQEHQREVLAAVAKMSPGATTDPESGRVTWSSSEGMITFSYGGCVHLGSIVSESARLAVPRTQEQIFSVARELATRNWSNEVVAASPATDALLAGLEGGGFRVERAQGKARFDVDDPGYVQLYVEHDYDSGVDTVTIGWQGNF